VSQVSKCGGQLGELGGSVIVYDQGCSDVLVADYVHCCSALFFLDLSISHGPGVTTRPGKYHTIA
jgi:hypothetical protein